MVVMKKQSELFFSLILLPLDFLAITSAFVVSYIIRFKLEHKPVTHYLAAFAYLKLILLMVPVWIFIFAIVGLYNLKSNRGRLEDIGRIVVAVSGGAMALIMFDFFNPSPVFPSKSIPVYGLILGIMFVIVVRQAVWLVQRYLFRYGVGLRQTVVVGSGAMAADLIRALGVKNSGYRLVAVVERGKSARTVEGVAYYDSLDAIKKLEAERHLDELFLADSRLSNDDAIELVGFANLNHIGFRFVPTLFGVLASRTEMDTLAGLPMLELRQTPLEGWGRIIKRIFDLVGAVLGLVVLSPVLAVVALLVYLNEPGPVFYGHDRVSKAGQTIKVYKFRSMKLAFCAGPEFSGKSTLQLVTEMGDPKLIEEFKRDQKLARDPRVTRVGRVLRKTSLDELPQLFNVLRGEMSLVGPRAVTEEELERYGRQRGRFLALKPGITGLWQVSGRSDLSYEERVRLDIYYVEHWSLWLDLVIIMKTLRVIVSGRGGY